MKSISSEKAGEGVEKAGDCIDMAGFVSIEGSSVAGRLPGKKHYGMFRSSQYSDNKGERWIGSRIKKKC